MQNIEKLKMLNKTIKNRPQKIARPTTLLASCFLWRRYIPMKAILLLLTIFISSTVSAFDFYSTNKSHSYKIDKFSEQVSKEYKNLYQMFAVVFAFSDNSSPTYSKQKSELAQLNMEALSTALITASTQKEYLHGYHTTTSQALKLLNGSELYVAIYAPNGSLIFQSNSLVPSKDIELKITEYNNSRQHTPSAQDQDKH